MITATGIAVPEDMVAALAQDPTALSTFEALRADDQRAYVNWLAKPGASSRQDRLTELAAHVLNHKHHSPSAE